MATATAPTKIKARLDDRLLHEISRFFGGWVPTLKEVFQNAHRAGAENVVLRCDPEGTWLEIHDDGEGCPEPEVLLSAGQTGWDETRITEPAGLGFFALLNPKWVKRIEVASHDWTFAVDTDKATTTEIPVSRGRKRVAGLRLKLFLTGTHEHLVSEVRASRGYYPQQVTLNAAIVPPVGIPQQVEIDTPVGKVRWDGNYSRHGRAYRRADEFYVSDQGVLWEHRLIDSAAFATAIQKAVDKLRVGKSLMQEMVKQLVVWEVDPDCGVRPKLPDRNELETGPQLDSAAAVIVKSLLIKVQQEVKDITDRWPDQFEDVPKVTLPKWLEAFANEIAWAAGFHRIKGTDYSELYAYRDDGSAVLDGSGSWSIWSRRPATPVDQGDVETLVFCRWGLEVAGLDRHRFRCAGEKDQALRVIVKGIDLGRLALAPELSSRKGEMISQAFICLAESITWNGVELPCYLPDVDDGELDELGGAWLVIAGDRAKAEAFVRGLDAEQRLALGGWLIHQADSAGEIWERGWIGEDYGDFDLHPDSAVDEILRELTLYFASDDEVAYLNRKEKLEGLHVQARSASGDLEGLCKGLSDPRDAEVLRKVELARVSAAQAVKLLEHALAGLQPPVASSASAG